MNHIIIENRNCTEKKYYFSVQFSAIFFGIAEQERILIDETFGLSSANQCKSVQFSAKKRAKSL